MAVSRALVERDPDDLAARERFAMPVTPEELRRLDLRESVRGYHRREVDALCERAAQTIESLQKRQRELAERLERETARRGAREVDDDLIRRTLIRAQRVADTAVAEAEAQASTLVRDAEARAEALVNEAEATARRVAESERRRAEAEVAELCGARDALTAQVDTLERFAAEYRERIRATVEAELERIGVPLTDLNPPARPPQLGVGVPGAPVPAVDPEDVPTPEIAAIPPDDADSTVGSSPSTALELATDRGVP